MSTPQDKPPQSVLRSRLASCDGHVLADWKDLGLEEAKDAAFHWQRQRSRAQWNEFVWLMEDAARSEWVREVHGLFGSIGELVLVGIEAEVEKTALRNTLARPRPNEQEEVLARAGRSRALRFFAEGQANGLVIAGHGVANLLIRTFALHPRLAAADLARAVELKAAQFRPGALERGAWASLNERTVTALDSQARVIAYEPFERLVDELKSLFRDARWVELHELRGTQYHRWRGESPGVTGINFRVDSLRARVDRGEAVGIGGNMLESYVEGERTIDDLDRVSRAALDSFVDFMPDFHAAWDEAFRQLRDV